MDTPAAKKLKSSIHPDHGIHVFKLGVLLGFNTFSELPDKYLIVQKKTKTKTETKKNKTD